MKERPPRVFPHGELGFKGILDLEATLHSGQAFRWIGAAKGAHQGFIENVPVEVVLGRSALRWTAASPLTDASIKAYFRLDGTHDAFLREVRPDPYLHAAFARFPGLRLLRQDPWETMVSFVISQNSNEKRIRATIAALSREVGEPVRFRGTTWHRFPTPKAVSKLDGPDLKRLGLGYRAPYVHAIARQVVEGSLDPSALPRLDYREAFERLLQVPGIGPKVADCILLYGCDQRRAFPTDVWVRRFIGETYLRRKRPVPSHERIREFAWRRWGPDAGYAQHFLFHYRRVVGRLVRAPS